MLQLIAVVLTSAVIATAVTFALHWWKERFEKQKEIERTRYEKLYAALSYHLLAMKVLNIGKAELLGGTSELSPNPLVVKWWKHTDKIVQLLEEGASHIKEEHLPLIEDFLAGRRHDSPERISNILSASKKLQSDILKKYNTKRSFWFDIEMFRHYALSLVLATLLLLMTLGVAFLFGA